MSRSGLIICLFIFLSTKAEAQGEMFSWKKVTQMDFLDVNGKKAQIANNGPTVFVMLSPECPLCRNYAPVLNSLQKQHPEVSFYGIFPGKAYGTKEISHFQKEYQVTLKALIDPQKKLSTYLKATTTPECIFINQLGVVVYRGLIDNWPSSLGQKRKVVTEKYLANALEHSRSGKMVETKQTKPIGCLINDL